MEVKRLSVEQVHTNKVSELGLDPTVLDLSSVESIAAALRRAAGFFCPCSALTLVRAVVRPLLGVIVDLEALQQLVEETLESMIAHGDLLEQPIVDSDPQRLNSVLVYAAPPSFVFRQSGSALLLGIAPDQLSPLPHELEVSIEYVNHIRRVPAEAAKDLRVELFQLGLLELSFANWLKAPPAESPGNHIARADRLLNEAPASHDIPGLTLLDSSRPVRYYKGRWVEPKSQTGRFVGRRRQAYGSDLWCYVQIKDGRPERFIDFPVVRSRERGCDVAWRLQMAIDAHRSEPQGFRSRPGPAGTRVLEFFSPVPMWARRRWDAVGEPVLGSGCLFAYRFTEGELLEELRFVREMLWLSEAT